MISRKEVNDIVKCILFEGIESALRGRKWSREMHNAIGLFCQGMMEKMKNRDADSFTPKEVSYIIWCAVSDRDNRVSLQRCVESLVYEGGVEYGFFTNEDDSV